MSHAEHEALVEVYEPRQLVLGLRDYECNGKDARNPDGGGSNGEALATIKSDGLMVAWGITNDRPNNRGVEVELASGIQHINATPCAFTTINLGNHGGQCRLRR